MSDKDLTVRGDEDKERKHVDSTLSNENKNKFITNIYSYVEVERGTSRVLN